MGLGSPSAISHRRPALGVGSERRCVRRPGNKEVGDFLWEILRLGATRDWREVIREKTGEDVSTRAMLEYFSPLLEYLKKENEGRDLSWGGLTA
jgi:peptidyl-dipeptidase A